VVREDPPGGYMGSGSVKEEVRPRPAEANRWHDGLGVSVVVCAHAEARWERTRAQWNLCSASVQDRRRCCW
jgi:hypothetical protein